MEWIKSMSLRKALFALTFIDLLITTLLSAAAFWGCMKLNTALVPSGEQIIIGADTAARTELERTSFAAGDSISVAGRDIPILATLDGYDGYVSVGNSRFTNGVQVSYQIASIPN